MRYSCVDAFSGAGGLSLGLQESGMEIIYSFDNDPNCIATQEANTKYFHHRSEVAGIDELLGGVLLKKLNLRRGEVFLLAGGPPCQGFSIQRIGNDEDFRNELVLRYIELVSELNPEFFIIENVPGIAGKRGRKILDKAIETANSLGYWTHIKKIDAQEFGVPQRRKRVFIIGERKNGSLPLFQFPSPTNSVSNVITVRDAIGHLPPPPEDGSDHPDIPNHRRDKISEINKQRLLALKAGQGREYLPDNLLAECHRVDASVIGHRNVYGRMAWDEPAPTITARFDSFTRGKFGHPEQIRSISLREGALLQTFPEDFIFIGSKVEIARQIGNAVPPILAEKLGAQLIHTSRVRVARFEEA